MTLEERLQFCRACTNRKMNPAIGLVCSLNDEKPQFEGNCADFNMDPVEAERLTRLQQDAEYEEETSGGFFGAEQRGIQKGVMGVLAMIAIAIVWFVVGWQMGYIYFYPPILLCIGIYALVKGLIKGNISGNKS